MTASNTIENSTTTNSKADKARAKLVETARDVQTEMDAAVQQGTREVKRFAEQSGRFVQDNPGLSLAAAAGFGLLVGLAIKSRY